MPSPRRVGEAPGDRCTCQATGGCCHTYAVPRDERRAAAIRRDMEAVAEAADILRQVVSHDGHLDPRRGAVSVSLAALVEALCRAYRALADVAACVMEW